MTNLFDSEGWNEFFFFLLVFVFLFNIKHEVWFDLSLLAFSQGGSIDFLLVKIR